MYKYILRWSSRRSNDCRCHRRRLFTTCSWQLFVCVCVCARLYFFYCLNLYIYWTIRIRAPNRLFILNRLVQVIRIKHSFCKRVFSCSVSLCPQQCQSMWLYETQFFFLFCFNCYTMSEHLSVYLTGKSRRFKWQINCGVIRKFKGFNQMLVKLK